MNNEVSLDNQGKMSSRGLWASLIIATLALALAIFNIQQSLYGWQSYLLIIFPSLIFIACLTGAFFAWRGRPLPAMWIALIGSWFLCGSAALLQQNLDWVAVIYFALSSIILGVWVMPARYRRSVMALALVGMVLVLLFKILNPPFRLDITALDVLGLYVAIALGLDFGVLVLIQLWTSGHLRNRIIAMIVAVLLPVLLFTSWYTVQAQRTELEQLLLASAKSKAMSGATIFGRLLEDAIASGALTHDQAFDRNYVDFWKFKPAMDPTFTGDPRTLDKYHTAYDSYTDKNWPKLLDSYLTEEDVMYAIPIDINGYIPTHNTRYAMGDGSAANDRTKRIFSDAVGLASSRNTEPILQQVYPRPGTNQILWDVSSPIYVNGEHWGGFRVGIQLAQNDQRVQAATLRSLVSSMLLIFIVVGFAWFLGTYISRPVENLTSVATKAANGQLDQHIDIPNRDEITTLGDAFNKMIAQLREMISSLEQRVADRTKALATSSEVSRRLSTILDRRQLVTEVVEQVKSAFNYYHAHIYLVDETNGDLVMAGGTGEAGRTMLANGHKVPKGKGLVGRAADTKKVVLVPDTSKDPTWLPNSLLPETKSEVAVPISIGDQVMGVLDVQQNVINGLQQEDVDSLQSIANQVAIALQNIQSTEIVAKRATELQTVATISTAAATISDVQKMLETVVHLTQRGFGLYHAHVFVYNEDTATLKITACGWKEGSEHEGAHVIDTILLAQEQSLVARAGRTRQAVIVNDVRNEPGWLPNPLLPDTASELAVPLIVADQLLGVLDVQSERLNAFSEEDASIQTTLASQVATAVQNARSLSQSQHQAERETTVNLITQKIQNAVTVEGALQVAVRELGHALGMRQTRVSLDPASSSASMKAIKDSGVSK